MAKANSKDVNIVFGTGVVPEKEWQSVAKTLEAATGGNVQFPTYKLNRHIAEEMTYPKGDARDVYQVVQGEIMELNGKPRTDKIRELELSGQLLSTSPYGLEDLGFIGKKLVHYIEAAQFEQIQHLGGLDTYRKTMEEYGLPSNGSYVAIPISDAAKCLFGKSETRQKQMIIKALEALDKQFVVIRNPDDKNSHWLSRLITIQAIHVNEKTKKKIYYVQLGGVFLHNIQSNFYSIPGRICKSLSVFKNEYELNLFTYLSRLLSYKGTRGWPSFTIDVGTLNSIVLSERIIKQRRKSEADKIIRCCLDRMIQIGIIRNIKIRKNSRGTGNNYVITLNEKWARGQAEEAPLLTAH